MTWTRSGPKAKADALEKIANAQKARKHALETEIDLIFIGIVRKKPGVGRRPESRTRSAQRRFRRGRQDSSKGA